MEFLKNNELFSFKYDGIDSKEYLYTLQEMSEGNTLCREYLFEDALKVTPPVGTVVMTSEGEGTVIEIKPLAREIKVKITDKEKDAVKNYKVSDVKILRTPKKSKSQESNDDVIPEE